MKNKLTIKLFGLNSFKSEIIHSALKTPSMKVNIR